MLIALSLLALGALCTYTGASLSALSAADGSIFPCCSNARLRHPVERCHPQTNASPLHYSTSITSPPDLWCNLLVGRHCHHIRRETCVALRVRSPTAKEDANNLKMWIYSIVFTLLSSASDCGGMLLFQAENVNDRGLSIPSAWPLLSQSLTQSQSESYTFSSWPS